MSTLQDQDAIKQLYQSSGKIDRRNVEYYNDSLDWLRDEHAGELIAIVNGEFGGGIEFTDNTDEVREFLDELSERYTPEQVRSAYITLVPDPDRMMLL